MAFEPRLYRNKMNRDRFRFFNIINKETDLWIGVPVNEYNIDLHKFCESKVSLYRSCLEKYIKNDPQFRESMIPLPVKQDIPHVVGLMLSAASKACVGPMAAVAGAVCEMLGRDVTDTFNLSELIIENGGDIFADVRDELLVEFYAGENQNFMNIALSIPEKSGSLGICTSSGMFGHSLSYGKADSVTVVCKSATSADALATSICNKIQNKSDIKPLLNEMKQIPEILSLIAVKDDEMGITGKFPLKMI